MEKKLEVKDLRISFRTDAGKVQAVRDISFDLYKNETLAIVGESGSGKSVTNKAIIGISAVNAIIESGEIIYDGMDLLKISEDDFHKLRGDKIAMIFQDPLSALDPICRIGKQLTEAMILKNRAARRDARRTFNRMTKRLLKAMDAAMGVEKGSDQAKANQKRIDDFDRFSSKHLSMEKVYNAAQQAAVVVVEEIDDLLFHIEKKAVSEFSKKVRHIVRHAKDSVHEHVVDAGIVALADEFKATAKEARSKKDYSLVVDVLNRMLVLAKEGVERVSPNYFALGYYLTFAGQPLPEMEIGELNAFLRAYLDEHYMLSFIEDEKKALQWSYERSLEAKRVVIDALAEARPLFAEGEADKQTFRAAAKALSEKVADSIDPLKLVKDSAAYTFKTSLRSAIDTYFDAIPNNAREQRRFDKETKRYDRIIARGKTPDYKVTPAKIVDLELARDNIVHILDNLSARYQKDLENRDSYDVAVEAVALIDFLKEKAQAVAYRVTPLVAKNKAIKLMEEVGIPEPERRYRQYPFQFSGGMRQRIVIAIALAANPDILICDEPTTALDVTIQAQILELINKLKRERNLSIIFITHDLGVVANMADRIAVMYAGKIVEMGTAEDIFYRPAHPYTWALLSSMPDLDTNEKLEAIPGTPPNMIYPPKGDAFAARNKYAMKIDFELQPPMFQISETHCAATWLLHPDAPKVDLPRPVAERIERMHRINSENARLKAEAEGDDHE